MKMTNKQNPFIKALCITLILSVILVSFNGCGGDGGDSSTVPAETTSGNTLPNSSGTSSTSTGSSTSTTVIGGGGNSPSIPTVIGYNPDTVTADDLPQNTEIPVVLSVF